MDKPTESGKINGKKFNTKFIVEANANGAIIYPIEEKPYKYDNFTFSNFAFTIRIKEPKIMKVNTVLKLLSISTFFDIADEKEINR